MDFNSEPIELPNKWGLSDQQDFVIGTLIDYAGNYVSADKLHKGVYGKSIGDGPAPARLRVLVQRCRDIVDKVSNGDVEITVRRNSGWKISKADANKMIKIIANTD